MSVVYGRPIVISSGRGSGPKWTVSLTEPASPKAGDLWVKAEPAACPVQRLRHIQSATNDLTALAAPEPNCIYILTPNGENSANAIEIPFASGLTYGQLLGCAMVLVTDSAGAPVQVDRAIYTGSAWQLWTAFPPEPSSYILAGTYRDSGELLAPESGYYELRLFGSSGNGGAGVSRLRYSEVGYAKYNGASGGSGGGGACAISRLKLQKGDKLLLTLGAAGEDASVEIQSSLETYDTLCCTGGSHGTAATYESIDCYAGAGGKAGGIASGGNLENLNGQPGTAGRSGSYSTYTNPNVQEIIGPDGGASGHPDGSPGGRGGNAEGDGPGAGAAAFVQLYRGDTNVAES